MKITVLADNRRCENSDIIIKEKYDCKVQNDAHKDCQFLTEHGLSVLVESGGRKVLMDTGASDVFARNAEMLGVDLSEVDWVFLSHGHADHAGGLRRFLELNKRAQVIVSPLALERVFYSKRKYTHSITTHWPIEALEGRVRLVTRTEMLDEGLGVIAQIGHQYPVPKGNRNLYVKTAEGELVPDDFGHELALYVDGLLFTGCAHNGLENILEACPWPVHTVLGGFHLLDAHLEERYESDEELRTMAERLTERYPDVQFYRSHCTGEHAFEVLRKVMGEKVKGLN